MQFFCVVAERPTASDGVAMVAGYREVIFVGSKEGCESHLKKVIEYRDKVNATDPRARLSSERLMLGTRYYVRSAIVTPA